MSADLIRRHLMVVGSSLLTCFLHGSLDAQRRERFSISFKRSEGWAEMWNVPTDVHIKYTIENNHLFNFSLARLLYCKTLFRDLDGILGGIQHSTVSLRLT